MGWVGDSWRGRRFAFACFSFRFRCCCCCAAVFVYKYAKAQLCVKLPLLADECCTCVPLCVCVCVFTFVYLLHTFRRCERGKYILYATEWAPNFWAHCQTMAVGCKLKTLSRLETFNTKPNNCCQPAVRAFSAYIRAPIYV